MLDVEQIQTMERNAAARAAREKLEPFIVWPQDKGHFPPFPFPFIGNYKPKGWRLVNKHFVDSSGFGGPGEPALTVWQFIERIRSGFGYAVIQAGEFQVYIGEFKQVNRKGMK